MLDYFYKEAQIPKVLKLKETYPSYNYLEDELNLMLDSPTCLVSVDLETNKLVAAIINTVWPVDNDFDAFNVNGADYLNTAAEIAHEVTDDPLLKTVIWRDYHFQLIYHKMQGHAQKRGSGYTLYGGKCIGNYIL